MKRLLYVGIILLAMLSCSSEYDILGYQQGSIFATCIINEKYTVNIIKEENFRSLAIVEPSELSNVSFSFDGSNWTAKSADIAIPINEEEIYGIRVLCSIFDLDEASITTAYDEGGIGIVGFCINDIEYQVSYNSLALPERIKITSQELCYDIEIVAISKETPLL